MTERHRPYVDFEVGGKNYMLRLTARSAVRLEDRIGCSIYEGVKRLSEIRVVTEIFYALLESLRPETTRSEAYLIFDEYINEGGTVTALTGIITDALEQSGFFDSGAAA